MKGRNKMMNNKEGFTLIELTTVIVLIAILSVLAVIPINNIIKNSRKELNESQKKQIVLAAQNWAIDNDDKLPKRGVNDADVKITLEDLYADGYLDNDVIDLNSNTQISKCSYVNISLIDENKNSGNTYTYEFKEEEC